MHTYMHTHTCIHTYIHAYIHICTHTRKHIITSICFPFMYPFNDPMFLVFFSQASTQPSIDMYLSAERGDLKSVKDCYERGGKPHFFYKPEDQKVGRFIISYLHLCVCVTSLYLLMTESMYIRFLRNACLCLSSL